MSFREKSAWAMGALMLFTGLTYGYHLGWQLAGGHFHIFALAHFTLVLVAASIVIQTVLAVIYRKEARQPVDERERIILLRAGHWSGLVLATGAVGSALAYLVHDAADVMFNGVIVSLIVAQFAQYAFQIALFRRGA